MNDRPLKFHHVGDFALECGTVLRNVVQAYHLDGELNEAKDNLIVVFHALTGSADVMAWWRDVVGPGRPLDTRKYAVLCTNLLGSCYGTRFIGSGRPPITTRDMARLVHRLVEELGIQSVALAVGGSLGGMVALEWAVTFGALTRTVVAFAAPAAQTAHSIGFNHIQRVAVETAGLEGLAIARMIGMMTYRTPTEFETRFGRERREDGRFQMQSYLDHHGGKLVARFDPASYLTLLDAMDSHDVGRGRGGVVPALRSYPGRLVGVGIPGDLLYAADEVRNWVEAAGGEYREIYSIRGHDAFLLDGDQVGPILRDALEADQAPAAARPAKEAIWRTH